MLNFNFHIPVAVVGDAKGVEGGTYHTFLYFAGQNGRSYRDRTYFLPFFVNECGDTKVPDRRDRVIGVNFRGFLYLVMVTSGFESYRHRSTVAGRDGAVDFGSRGAGTTGGNPADPQGIGAGIIDIESMADFRFLGEIAEIVKRIRPGVGEVFTEGNPARENKQAKQAGREKRRTKPKIKF